MEFHKQISFRDSHCGLRESWQRFCVVVQWPRGSHYSLSACLWMEELGEGV